MTSLLLYFSGIITTLAVLGLFYYRYKFKKVSGLYETLVELSTDTFKEKKDRDSLKRMAKYTWKGFFYKKEPNTKWDAIYELKEVAQSADGTKSKFEVISVTSQNIDEIGQEDWYKDWFVKKTGGGWITTSNNSELEWITTLSKEEERAIKLNQLGL